MAKVEHRDFAEPDEVRTFDNGRAEILNTDSGAMAREAPTTLLSLSRTWWP
jgi:hypothetical protein